MASTPLELPLARSSGERRMYTWAAIVAIVVMFAGFAPTYYLKGVFASPDLDTLKHVHGVIMTAWFAFFLLQVRLVATGNTRIHRQLGIGGVVLAMLVVYVGITAGIASARSGAAPNGIPPLVFLVLPFGEMVAFTGLFAAAIALRRRSAWHKRLMLVATVAMLTPAVARMPFDVIKSLGPPAFFGFTDLLIVACMAFDAVKNRRVHPAFVAGLAFVVFVQVGRLLLSRTEAWMTFARWVVG